MFNCLSTFFNSADEEKPAVMYGIMTTSSYNNQDPLPYIFASYDDCKAYVDVRSVQSPQYQYVIFSGLFVKNVNGNVYEGKICPLYMRTRTTPVKCCPIMIYESDKDAQTTMMTMINSGVSPSTDFFYSNSAYVAAGTTPDRVPYMASNEFHNVVVPAYIVTRP